MHIGSVRLVYAAVQLGTNSYKIVIQQKSQHITYVSTTTCMIILGCYEMKTHF